MADENIRTTMQFQADITDFKAAMQEANRSIKLANSEFKAASSGMDDWANSTDGLAAKMRQQSSVLDAQKRQLDVLNAAYAKAVEEQGATSAAAQDLLIKINNQQAAINKSAKEYDSYAAKLNEVEQAASGAAADIDKAGDAAKDAGDEAESSSDGWTIAKDVIADFVSNAIQGAIDALVSVAEATREYRREMAQLAQNATDSGHNVDAMKETLSGVAAVTGDAGAAMEGLNMLMASGFNTEEVQFAAEALAGAATKFDGVNFEGIAEGLQETLSTGAAAGPFAEVIERMGGDLDAFNEGLAACTTEAERQQYALDWLAQSGLKSVHDSYVQNNADLVAAEEAQFRYNDALASVGAAVEPINTALSNLAAMILEKVAPVVEDIVQWVLDNLPAIAPLIAGIASALGVLAVALGIQALISGVTKAFALLNTTMLANPFVLIVALIAGVVAAFVALWNKSESFRNFFKNLWTNIKKMVSDAVASIVNTFNSVISWLSDLPEKVGRIALNALNVVVRWGADMIAKGKAAASGLVSAVVEYISSLPGKMLEIGGNIVSGIWSGISNGLSWIKGKITGWVGDVLGFIKNLFGINSPSTVMRDEVGKMLGLGMAEGITRSRSAVNGAVRKLGDAALDGLHGGTGGVPAAGLAGGKTIIFNQTNNSPRALSRREIYRQTHNALSFAGGA